MSDLTDDLRGYFNHETTDYAAWKIESMEEEINDLRAELAELKKPGYILMPVNPEPETIDRAVSFALNVSLSADYTWSQYMTDLYKHMMVR